MEPANRQSADTVGEKLFRQPYAYSFEQAVRLLERLHPEAVPLGTGSHPTKEAVRLGGMLSPQFPVSAIGSLEKEGSGDARAASSRTRMTVLLFGLGGTDGALPYAFQEMLQQYRRSRQDAPADFLDIFQHRLLSHLYRALGKYRLAAPYTMPENSTGMLFMRALSGLLSEPLHEPRFFPDRYLPVHAALLANRRRSAGGFIAMLYVALGVKASVEEFQGRWLPLQKEQCSTIGRNGNAVLGQSPIAGRHVWAQHAALCLHLHDINAAHSPLFLPGGRNFVRLRSLAAFYFGRMVDIELILHVENAAFSHTLDSARPMRLGWTGRLGGPAASKYRICLDLTGTGENT